MELPEVVQIKNILRKARRKVVTTAGRIGSAVSVPSPPECASVPAGQGNAEDYPGEYNEEFEYAVSHIVQLAIYDIFCNNNITLRDDFD
jgi:hypothetical protein